MTKQAVPNGPYSINNLATGSFLDYINTQNQYEVRTSVVDPDKPGKYFIWQVLDMGGGIRISVF